MMMKNIRQNNKGVTLIEVIMAIIIAGILAAVAMRSAVNITENGRTEITKTEMSDIAIAMVGNNALQNNNTRNNFGYVGDVGAMPANIDALITNPGGYATWHGPYIKNRFSQITNDYSQDAWGVTYTFSGVDITSSGSGTSIVHKIGETTSDFLLNSVSGNIYDSDGTPPGSIYKDSITILLTIPNGSGGFITKGISPDFGGYFSFDSIPIGNQDIQIIYNSTSDTLKRFVTITPKSSVYDEYLFPSNYWISSITSGGSGSIVYMTGTALTKTGNCDRIEFDITNISGSPINLTNITIAWLTPPGPTAFYEKVRFGSQEVVDVNPQIASGSLATFDATQTLNANQTVTIRLDDFRAQSDGNGGSVNMSNTDFTITFSDGSVVTFNSGSCP